MNAAYAVETLPSQPPPASQHLAVLVNTSDGFDDCWHPFFHLLDLFGGDLRNAPIYLNTERKNFAWPGLDLHATQVWPSQETARPTWSQCLQRAVASIPEPYILHLQEDYFLTAPVDSQRLHHAVRVLERNPQIGAAYLFREGPRYRRSSPYDDLFVQIAPPSKYLVNTQAAVWRKDALLSLLRPWENGWMFEIFSSHRAARSPWKFLAVRPEIDASHPVIDYIHTGVIKGRWKLECVPLFERHGISVDFAQRGFYRQASRLKSRLEVARKLSQSPGNLVRSMLTLLER